MGCSRTGEATRNDLPDNPKWLVACVHELVFLRLDYLPMDLVRPASVVPDCADGQWNVHRLSAVESLAIVEGLDRCKFVGVLVHEVGKFVEENPALSTGNIETP